MQEMQVRLLGQEDSLEGKWQLTPEFLPEKFHGQKSLAGYSNYRVAKSWTPLNNWARMHTVELNVIIP